MRIMDFALQETALLMTYSVHSKPDVTLKTEVIY